MTNKEFYEAFNLAKKVYGADEVHVNLMAKQLGIPAIDVVRYANENHSQLKVRELRPRDGFKNDVMGKLYPGLYIVNVKPMLWLNAAYEIEEGDNGAEVTLTGATFDKGTVASNFIVDAGTTGLTLDSVNSGTVNKKLTFTGTVKPGILRIIAKASVLDDYSVDSDVVKIVIPEKTFNRAAYAELLARIEALEDESD